MRHKDPRLTAMCYTDPKLLEIRSSLDARLMLPLDRENRDASSAAMDARLALLLATEADLWWLPESTGVTEVTETGPHDSPGVAS